MFIRSRLSSSSIIIIIIVVIVLSAYTQNSYTEDIAIGKSSVAKYSGYHHHHVEDYDYVDDIDEDGYDFDDTVNDLLSFSSLAVLVWSGG